MPADVEGLQPPTEVADQLQHCRDGTPLEQQPPMDEAGRLALDNYCSNKIVEAAGAIGGGSKLVASKTLVVETMVSLRGWRTLSLLMVTIPM